MGPLLFLIYINDLPSCLNSGHCVLFADDTTFSVQNVDYRTLETSAGEMQSTANDWFKGNNLVLNVDKTQQMVFSLRDVPDQTFPQDSVRFLGVHLDQKLKWDSHIEYLLGKMKSGIFVLRNLKDTVSDDVLRMTYYAVIHSLLSYAIVAWGHAAECYRVFSLQRRAIRILSNLGYRDDCRGGFISLNILTFPSIYILETLLFVRNNIDMYPTNLHIHSLDTRGKELLTIPALRLSKSQNGPNYLGIKFFNKLPPEVRHLEPKQFKRWVHGFLARHPFYSVAEFLNTKLECDLKRL